MTLSNTIREKITQAMKSGDTLARDVLKYALSEIQAAQTRTKGDTSEEEEQRLIRKIIMANDANIIHADSQEKLDIIKRESEILMDLLPPLMDKEEIIEFLRPYHPDIKNCRSDGQATGIAIKTIKCDAKIADGKTVAEVVREIRAFPC